MLLVQVLGTSPTRSLNHSKYSFTAAQAERRGNVDIALVYVMRDALLRRSEAAALTWAVARRIRKARGLCSS